MRLRGFSATVLAAFVCAAGAQAQGPPDYRLLELDGRIVKWGGPELGAGATITYALVDERMEFPAARNCRTTEPASTLVAATGLDAAAFEQVVSRAFSAWRAAANVDFHKADNPASADILIGADGSGGGWAFADVQTLEKGGGVGVIERAVVCLNPAQPWKIGFGGASDAQDLFVTLTHEIGHALGLNHPSPHGQIMSFTYGERFDRLQEGDIEGVRTLYGPPEDRPLYAGRPETAAR